MPVRESRDQGTRSREYNFDVAFPELTRSTDENTLLLGIPRICLPFDKPERRSRVRSEVPFRSELNFRPNSLASRGKPAGFHGGLKNTVLIRPRVGIKVSRAIRSREISSCAASEWFGMRRASSSFSRRRYRRTTERSSGKAPRRRAPGSNKRTGRMKKHFRSF